MILKQLIRYPDTNSVEATWVDEDGNPVRCQSYADAQMDHLRIDLGDDVAAYYALISLVEANISPPVLPTKTERIAALTAQYKANVAALQLLWLAASVTGGTSEATKKATIAQDLSDLKTQYTTDLNTIRNS